MRVVWQVVTFRITAAATISASRTTAMRAEDRCGEPTGATTKPSASRTRPTKWTRWTQDPEPMACDGSWKGTEG